MTVPRSVCRTAAHVASRQAVTNDCRVRDGLRINNLAAILIQ